MTRSNTAELVLQHIHGLVTIPTDRLLTDAALLRQFARHRDEAAFTELVRRHGPMVLGVGRRALGNVHDADDILQATFLVLARKAGSVRRQGSVASWLHGVAVRLARKAVAEAARRPGPELARGEAVTHDPLADVTGRELLAALDEELNRLPERLRAPLVLCHVEGLTQDEAARELGWSKGTLRRRLQAGRDLLRARMVGRGLGLGAGLFAALLVEANARAALTPTLARAAVSAALRSAASANVLLLAEHGLRLTAPSHLRRGLVLALLVAALGVVGGVVWHPPAMPPPAADADPSPLVPVERPLAGGIVARITPRLQPDSDVNAILCTPDGKTLVAATARSVMVWDMTTGTLRRKIEKPGVHFNLQPAGLTRDGSTLAVKDGQEAVVYDLTSGREVRRVEDVWGLALSPDEQTLAVVHRTGKVSLLNLASGMEVGSLDEEFSGHDIECPLAFSPDGKFLAAAVISDRGRIWAVAEREALGRINADVHSLCFSPDGRSLSVGSEVFDFQTGQRRPRLGPEGAYRGCCSPDGKTFASWGATTTGVSADGSKWTSRQSGRDVFLWDVEGGRERCRVRVHGGVISASFLPDGKTIVTGDTHGGLYFWDAFTGQPSPPFGGHHGPVVSLRFSADGTRLISRDTTGVVCQWQALTGVLLDQDSSETPPPHPRGGNPAAVLLARSPDGTTLAWSEPTPTGPTVLLTDAVSGKERSRLAGCRGVAFSPDGNRLVSVDSPSRLIGGFDTPPLPFRLWDVNTRRQLATAEFDEQDAGSVAFSPDGKTLAVGCHGRTIRMHLPAPSMVTRRSGVYLWDVEKGVTRLRVHEHETSVTAVAFSPDGRLLASAGEDGTILVYALGERP